MPQKFLKLFKKSRGVAQLLSVLRQFLKSFNKPRGVAQLLFVIIGLLGLIWLLFFCPEWLDKNNKLENTLRGMCNALFLVGGLDLLSAFFQAAADRPDRDRFERFFGSGISNKVVAIFSSGTPDRDPNSSCLNAMNFPNAPQDALDKKAKGAAYLVASQELDAAIELADTFGSFGEEFKTELDYLYLNKDLDRSGKLR